MLINAEIDHGKAFDWSKASADYAKYRDIYPQEFYRKLLDARLCIDGQKVLDIGTGTGVLPRSLYQYGAEFTGIDIAEEQIEQAKVLAESAGMEIRFQCVPAERIHFPDQSFDVVTACQCFPYFDHDVLAPQLHRLLKNSGRFAVLYMAWLPFEDEIAGKSEELILKYNPDWTGGGEKRHPILIPDCYADYFNIESSQVFDLRVPFTRETWNGRMKSCRGIGASLSAEETAQFEQEHRELLNHIAPERFEILHYAAITILKKKQLT